MSPLRGERPDRATYRILDRLSSGLGDDVFLAHHEIFDGRVVQKTVFMHGLEDALASNEPAFLNRLDTRGSSRCARRSGTPPRITRSRS